MKNKEQADANILSILADFAMGGITISQALKEINEVIDYYIINS